MIKELAFICWYLCERRLLAWQSYRNRYRIRMTIINAGNKEWDKLMTNLIIIIDRRSENILMLVLPFTHFYFMQRINVVSMVHCS
jgi:hypothetical protein